MKQNSEFQAFANKAPKQTVSVLRHGPFSPAAGGSARLSQEHGLLQPWGEEWRAGKQWTVGTGKSRRGRKGGAKQQELRGSALLFDGWGTRKPLEWHNLQDDRGGTLTV